MPSAAHWTTEELEAELERRVAAYERSGRRDVRLLEDEGDGADLSSAPVALLGVGAAIAAPFVEHALRSLDVRLLVDNPRQGREMFGRIMAGDEDFLELAARMPDLVAVICAPGGWGMDHFVPLTRRAGVRTMLLFHAMRHFHWRNCGTERPFLDFINPDHSIAAWRQARAAGWYGEPECRRTLAALMLFRLSWAPHWLDQARRPYERIYFGSDAMAVGPDEILVDGGAFTGDTVADFHAHTGGRWGHVHSFEPDPVNASRFRDTVGAMDGVTLHRCGLWSRGTTLRFQGSGQIGSAVDEAGTEEIPVAALDELDLGPVTLFKLDVEGSEAEALRGAAETIRRNKPKLLLSAYHRAGDIGNLAALAAELRPDYRFRLRHHSIGFLDTVIYAE
ncbi:MAG TPA: FkbM family methyltransferase [Azospirillaceae bacterium]|nr:FkbM family methyltransferase [Azospirillaceae bacterium]